jgi:hypothetical protein
VMGAVMMICAARADAIALGQVDTFQDGTTMGWRHGSPTSPLPPVNVNAGGPGGLSDSYLLIRTDGSEDGSASKLLGLNTAQWQGDYLAAGIGQIRLDARNPNNVDLVLRLGFRGGGAIFVTNGVTLSAGSDWSQVSFDLGASNMAFASGGYDACFGGVTMMRILHNPLTPGGDSGEPVRDAGGNAIVAQLGIDNITSVPEPAMAAVFGIATLAAATGRRRP